METYMHRVIELVDLNQNKPLNQIIYEGLRTAIISGVIPTGQRINEKQYAELLNVSRTPVREALSRIQDEDIVEYIPNFGIVVRQFTKDDVNEIYQIRIALDVLASENAMNRMTDEDIVYAKDLLARTDEAQRNNDVSLVIELSRDFNTMIYRFAKMPHLETIQNRLRDYLSRFRDISLTANDRRELALYEHHMILRCLINKDVEQVRMVITEHLALSKDFIMIELEKENAKRNL